VANVHGHVQAQAGEQAKVTAEAERRRSGPGQPKVISSRSGSGPARQASASLERRMTMRGVELVALAHLLRDRRFQQSVITGMIGLAALVSMAREVRARGLARLMAWDKRQDRRLQRTVAVRRRR